MIIMRVDVTLLTEKAILRSRDARAKKNRNTLGRV